MEIEFGDKEGVEVITQDYLNRLNTLWERAMSNRYLKILSGYAPGD